MFIAGLFSVFFRFILLCMGFSAGNATAHGDAKASVILLMVVALWNWRRILNFIADRAWRDYDLWWDFKDFVADRFQRR